MHKNVPDDKKLEIPQYCTMPSRVVQLLNMVSLEDLFDTTTLDQVRQDTIDECAQFGEVVSLQIPSPLFHLQLRSEVELNEPAL